MKTDLELKQDVQSELLWDPLVPEARIGVAVNDGVVSLTGHLDTYPKKSQPSGPWNGLAMSRQLPLNLMSSLQAFISAVTPRSPPPWSTP